LSGFPVKAPFICPRDWGMHSCFLQPDHKGTHLCVCGERFRHELNCAGCGREWALCKCGISFKQ
jgi:hypothetical protein